MGGPQEGGVMESAALSRRDPLRGERAREAEARATLSTWTVADPGPLGLAAFALTTFVLSMFNSDLVSDKGAPVVLALALAYGGVVQVLAGMWEFRTGNTFGAVAFSSFGGFWISFWAFVTFFEDKVPKSHLGSTVGLYLIAWGIFTTYMFVASLRTTAAVSLVFLLLATTYFLLGAGQANESKDVIHLGGYFGIATAAAAWYASFAAVANSTFGRTLLPVISLKREPAATPAGPAARETATPETTDVRH